MYQDIGDIRDKGVIEVKADTSAYNKKTIGSNSQRSDNSSNSLKQQVNN